MEIQDIHLRDYLRVLNKRKYTILTFFSIVLLVTVIVTFTITPVYKATTRVLIEKNEQDPFSSGSFVRFDPEFQETQYQIIKSFNVAKSVVEKLGLDTRYRQYFIEDEKKGSIVSFFKKIPGMILEVNEDYSKESRLSAVDQSLLPEKKVVDVIALYLSGELEIDPVKKTRIVNVSFPHENATLAAMITNSFAKAYIEEVMEINMSSSSQKLKWMTKKVDEERIKLEESEKALQKYMRDKDIITIENRIAVIPQKLQEYSTKLSQAEARRKELEEIVKKIDAYGDNLSAIQTLPGFSEDKTLQTIKDQLLEAEKNIDELSKKYGDKHPAMIKAKGEKDIFTDKLIIELDRKIDSIRNEFDLARANTRNLTRLLADTKQQAMFLNEKFVQHSILKREVDSNRVLYQTLLKELKKQSIAKQNQAVNVWVVEPAQVPEFPDSPRKKINILLGMILGLFGGIGIAFLIEYLDNTVKSVEEVEQKFDVTVLGSVPKYKEKDIKVEQASVLDPKSIMAETYKAIRTSILLSSAETPPKKLIITSMSPGEGKSTTSSNLASTLAANNYKVVLIDCDLRKSRVHKIFELDNSIGLSSYLAGAVTDEREIIQSDQKIANHDIISAGIAPPNPSELLSAKRFEELIKKLEKQYDYVLIDSPPIMNVTDSLIVSKVVDAMIVVCRAGKTRYDMIKNGIKMLRNVNANVLGFIINDVEDRHSGYYYSYQSYYGNDTDSAA